MRKIASVSLSFLFVYCYSIAQILPKESAELNFRIIGFSVPETSKPKGYLLEIAVGNFNTESSFEKNIIVKQNGALHKFIAEIPSFGCDYTWRITTLNTRSENQKSSFHHFKTGFIPFVDTNMCRLRILRKSEKYKEAYVFAENNMTLYDMKGSPIWYVPEVEGHSYLNSGVDDLKISPFGTITLFYNDEPYEINYEGNILWKGPRNGTLSGDTTEHFHNEFTRLKNGHYMVFGTKTETWKKLDSDTEFEKISLPTLIEYDSTGKITWSWKFADYYRTTDLYQVRYKKSNRYNTHELKEMHENSFFFDEKNKMIYISFRNVSRILKINYPQGNIISTYGEIFKPGIEPTGNNLFCGQHSVRISQKGYLYLFNNNINCQEPFLPKIVMMKQTSDNKTGLTKIWEFTCSREGSDSLKNSGRGGNVWELPDGSIFASMGTSYSKLFIVGLDKKIKWSALPEKWNPDEKKWYVVPQYRASIITSRKELEQLIWNGEK